MNAGFDGYIGIDWSGGRLTHGIAVARCKPGCTGPKIVEPPDGRIWTRRGVLAWLRSELASSQRLLIGFDFAFSLPFERVEARFPDPPSDARGLWRRVAGFALEAEDFVPDRFLADPGHGPAFWTSGPRPADFLFRPRATEDRCRLDGLGSPESPFKLIGAKQVGRAALSGMPLLDRLTADPRVAVWPFEEPEARSVVTEIYPRLFIRLAGLGNGKIKEPSKLDEALARLGSEPAAYGSWLDDHRADALVSAAGLRLMSGLETAWRPEGLDERARQAEGWIFGVGAGGHPGPGRPEKVVSRRAQRTGVE